MFKIRKPVIVLVFLVLVGIGLFLRNFFKRHYVVPILMYHYVHPDSSKQDRLCVSPESFEAQMRFLKEHNYNVVSLESLAGLIKERAGIPPRTVAITVDDGVKDCFTYIFPVLKKYNLPAAMFIIIEEVGRPQNDRLTWDEIKIMQNSGLVTFGSHALDPEPLVNIKFEDELKRQIFDSKRILEARLGRKVDMFSYPEGFFNDKIKQLVTKSGYGLAVTTMPGRDYPNDDIFALKRLRISPSSDNMFVFWFETSGIYTFLRESDKD